MSFVNLCKSYEQKVSIILGFFDIHMYTNTNSVGVFIDGVYKLTVMGF